MREGLNLKNTTINSLLTKYKLNIPPFQRKLVWNKFKKEELIDSLIKEFPIGAITLFYDNEKNNYLVVDGLQRINTIRTYLSNPNSVISSKKFIDSISDELIKFANDYNYEYKKLDKVLTKWYKNIDSEESLDYLFKDFELLSKYLNIKGIENILSNFKQFQEFRNIAIKNIDISSQEIAIIEYKGDVNDLPDLFTKINQKSVSLTPYEILHSMWYNFEIPDSIQQRKYKKIFLNMIENDDNYEHNIGEINSFNMYMNLSALGFLLWNEESDDIKEYFQDYKYSFMKKPEITFDIFSTLFTGTTNKVDKAVRAIFESKDNKDIYNFIFDLNEEITKCIRKLNRYLEDNKINFITSKYYYIYLFYAIFLTKNRLNKKDFSLIKLFNNFPDNVFDFEKHKKGKWFTDENRQLKFFQDKVQDLENMYLNNNDF